MNLYKLKITIRNARKNGVLSFAKVFGLSLSFAVILFASGYVYFETSFDKNIPDYNKIYRCLMQGQLNEETADYAVTSPAQAAAITSDIPEITEAVRILSAGNSNLKIDEALVNGGPLFYTDPEFFSFFSRSKSGICLQKGHPGKKNSLVLPPIRPGKSSRKGNNQYTKCRNKPNHGK